MFSTPDDISQPHWVIGPVQIQDTTSEIGTGRLKSSHPRVCERRGKDRQCSDSPAMQPSK